MGRAIDPRRLLRPVVCLALAPVAVTAAGVWTGGILGIGWYLALVLLVVLWNTFAAYRTLSTRGWPLRRLLGAESAALVAGYILVWVVWSAFAVDLWQRHRAWYCAGYTVAAAVTALLVWRDPSTRRLRNVLIVVYNVLGALALGAWAACDWNVDGTVALHSAAHAWASLQALLFTDLARLAPILFLPPLLVLEPRRLETPEAVAEEGAPSSDVAVEDEEMEAVPPELPSPPTEGRPPAAPLRGPSLARRASSAGLDASLGAVVVMLLVAMPIGAIDILSWGPPGEGGTPVAAPDIEFAATGRAFTGLARPPDDWARVVEDEARHAKALGLDLVRYDLYHEMLSNNTSLAELDTAVSTLRASGLDVILNPVGSGRWETDRTTFEVMVDVIAEDAQLIVARWQPAWVSPFIEPNGRSAARLGSTVPVEEWVAAIDAVAREVRALSNSTRVLAEVAAGAGHDRELVEALSSPTVAVDAIGVNVYPLNEAEMGALVDLRGRATHPSRGFWVSEVGAEASVLGERAQARVVRLACELAVGDLNATGICVWALLDDVALPNNMGLVGRDGGPREAFRELEDAIRAARGG